MIPDCTLTTAIYPSKNPHHIARTLEETVEACESLLSIPIYLVIYGNKETIPIIKTVRHKHGFEKMTVFNEVEKEDLWSFQYIDKVRENRSKYWPTKDPRNDENIHLLQCNKSDFVLKTIDQNPFKTTKFGWIDAFLGKDKMRICQNYDKLVLPRILARISDKFKIQVINSCEKRYKNPMFKSEYYQSYRWVVCGGFYTCGAEIGRKVLARHKEIFIQTTEQGFGHGEEMLYLEILDEFYDDIERSYGDYGQILNNFIEPTVDIHYIYHAILHNCMTNAQYREAYDCAKALVNAMELHITDVSYDIYLAIFVHYYNSAKLIKPEEAVGLGQKILNQCERHPVLKAEYDKNPDYYQWLFV